MNSGMMKMLSGFTVLRMINMMGLTSQMTSQVGEAEKTNEVSKEQLLAINDRLNQIRKLNFYYNDNGWKVNKHKFCQK